MRAALDLSDHRLLLSKLYDVLKVVHCLLIMILLSPENGHGPVQLLGNE